MFRKMGPLWLPTRNFLSFLRNRRYIFLTFASYPPFPRNRVLFRIFPRPMQVPWGLHVSRSRSSPQILDSVSVQLTSLFLTRWHQYMCMYRLYRQRTWRFCLQVYTSSCSRLQSVLPPDYPILTVLDYQDHAFLRIAIFKVILSPGINYFLHHRQTRWSKK